MPLADLLREIEGLPGLHRAAYAALYRAHRGAGATAEDAAAKAFAVVRGLPRPGAGPLPEEPGSAPARKDASVLCRVVKTDPELRVVWGWASVIEEGGEPVVDLQGDIITEPDLLAAAHDFAGVRAIKAMHGGPDVGVLVESVVFTRALQDALGIELGKVGWLIGARIYDDTAWEKAKRGEFPAFSIGGTGMRVPVGA